MPGPPALVTAVVAAPWGPIHVAASRRGVVAMANLVSDVDFVRSLERRFRGARSGDLEDRVAAAMLGRAVRAIEQFVEGDPTALRDLPLDLEDRPDWDRRVFEAVRRIRPGTTASYGEVARRIGTPGAARAVGGAVGRCPAALVVPCHRVIAGDGSIGGYGGGGWGGRDAGIALKRELLAREGVHPVEVAANGVRLRAGRNRGAIGR